MDGFDDKWRHVEGRLLRLLALRGVDAHAARDIAQEVAERVIRKNVRFDEADELYPWARHVAQQLAIDHFRRLDRIWWTELTEDVELDGSIEDVIDHRQQLRRVADALARLSPSDRALILSDVNDDGKRPPTRLLQVRTNVARHRARARLVSLLRGDDEDPANDDERPEACV